MMKIFFVIILYIFFAFLINNKINERFQETCSPACLQQMNTQAQQNTATNIQQLSAQVSNLATQLNLVDQKATNALNLATVTSNSLEEIRKQVTGSGDKSVGAT